MTQLFLRGVACLLCILIATPLRAERTALDDAATAIVQRHAEAPLLVIGEMHGTAEAPALIAELAQRLVKVSALTVGLEIPAQQQARLDVYLVSDGSTAARRALLDGAFWKRPQERSDGRRSQAMLQLIERLRVLRAAHSNLGVLAFDDERFYQQERSRDSLMADVLRAAHTVHPQAKLLVLTGNYHARLDQPRQVRSGDQMIQPPMPMTGLLQDLGVVSVYLAARDGEYWGCTTPTTPCGIQTLPTPTKSVGDGQAIALRPLPPGSSFHVQVELPRFQASAPVVVPSSAEPGGGLGGS